MGVKGVAEGVVVFNNSPAESERELGALVSLEQGFSVDALRDALKKRLPGYMVPSRLIVTQGEFPRTSNGKYNRKRATQLVFGAKGT